jgi:hypothetical protein
MPTGRETSEGGGVLSSADVRGAGTTEWANLIGIGPDHPLVSSEGTGPYLINGNYSRIVTTPAGQSGSASEGGLAAVPDGMGRDGLKHLDSWRDLFNFKGSPMPWLLLVTHQYRRALAPSVKTPPLAPPSGRCPDGGVRPSIGGPDRPRDPHFLHA